MDVDAVNSLSSGKKERVIESTRWLFQVRWSTFFNESNGKQLYGKGKQSKSWSKREGKGKSKENKGKFKAKSKGS